ncbi:MAG: DUF2723 domain-containing protein [Elusimicrobia bacterium]|nr:DUF2723 domain-containing protein [Elusimicrobiota bacterium]
MTDGDARRDRRDAALLGVTLSGLFWAGRSRSFGPGDSAQHLVAALTWGVPHPPGYPLQTALGWLWSRPFADPGAAVNGLSGVLAAAAAAFLYVLMRRSGARRAAALTAAGLMALSPLFWYYSLVAEVRALNHLLALAAACFVLEWKRAGRARDLVAAAALSGLGVSHHPTFPLLAPAFAVWAFSRRVPARTLALGAAALAAGVVAPYALLWARLAVSAPAYNTFAVSGPADLLGLFLRRPLGGVARMSAGSWTRGFDGLDAGALRGQAGAFAGSLWTHAGPAGLALAAAGAASLWRRDRRECAGWALWLLAAAATPAVFAAVQLRAYDAEYARGVVARFHLLPLIAVFALAGHGAEALARRVRPAAPGALAAAVFLVPLLLRPLSLAGADPLLDYARALLRDSGPRDILVLASDDTNFAMLDLDLVRRETGDRVFLAPTMFAAPSYRAALARRHPGLVLPARPTLDWAEWRRLNPGRAVLLEPSLLDPVLRDFPRSVPQGVLVRVETSAVRGDPAEDARRFLAAPETWSVPRFAVRPWTQETYVPAARRRMARWLASRLDPARDARELAALRVFVEDF